MCQKTGEISLLKQQLRDCQADVSHKLNEIVSLRALVKDNTAKMEMLEKQNKDHADNLHSRTIEVEVSLLMNQFTAVPTQKERLRMDICFYVCTQLRPSDC